MSTTIFCDRKLCDISVQEFLGPIRKIFKVNQDKAIIYDEENGEKEITTADLGIASYLCEDTDPVKAPVITKIRNLDECLNYFWFDKIAEKELASINRTEYIRQQMEIQLRFSNNHSTVCAWYLVLVRTVRLVVFSKGFLFR